MGIISNYGELKTAMADYTARSANPTWLANRPGFIRRAHDVIARELRIPLTQKTADMTISAEAATPPSDARAVSRLTLVSPSAQITLWPTSSDIRAKLAASLPTGAPQYFAAEGSTLVFAPIPDQSYIATLVYWAGFTYFSSDSDTNAVLTRHPHLYLYGALAEAARFDKFDEEISYYDGLFNAELNAIQIAEQLDAWMGGTMQPMPSVGLGAVTTAVRASGAGGPAILGLDGDGPVLGLG